MAEFIDPRSDQELISDANEGDESAFESLYLRYRAWVYTIAIRLTENEEDATDVLQECFFYLFNKFPGFKLEAQLKTLLYPTVRHLSLNAIQRKKKIKTVQSEEAETLPAPQLASEDEDKSNLKEMVKSLKPELKEVVMLRFADQFEVKEIAMAMNIPEGTVKSRLHNALKILKNQMDNK